MHGIILYGLKKFVVDTYDESAWQAVRERADVEGGLYIPVTTYPDEDVFELIGAASELTGESPEDLQYAFGRYIVPKLVETYGVHVDRDWTGLDLVENVEKYIHQALRAKKIADFAPPGIGAERLDERRVLVTYGSDRQLCHVARGILDGVADYYEEPWTISERTCMHDGDARCEFLVEQSPTSATAAGTARSRRSVSDD